MRPSLCVCVGEFVCMSISTPLPISFFMGVWLTASVCMLLLWVNRAHFYTWLTPSLHLFVCIWTGLLVSLSQSFLYTGSCCSCGKDLLYFIWLTDDSDGDLCVCLCAERRQREFTQTMQINASTIYLKISMGGYQLNGSQMKWKQKWNENKTRSKPDIFLQQIQEVVTHGGTTGQGERWS